MSEPTQTSGGQSQAVLQAIKQIDLVKDVKNLPNVPCAQKALLFGISGGAAVGSIRFIASRRVLSASNWAIAGFGVLSLAAWSNCRYRRTEELKRMKAVQDSFREKKRSPPKGQFVGTHFPDTAAQPDQPSPKKPEDTRKLV